MKTSEVRDGGIYRMKTEEPAGPRNMELALSCSLNINLHTRRTYSASPPQKDTNAGRRHTKQSMKMQAVMSAVVLGVGLLFALNGVHMVSARHNWHAPQTMFAFGDSFIDAGNTLRSSHWYDTSRQWFYPYGIWNDEGTATGRFSDFMVQSDFIAKMLGLHMSPPAYESTWPSGSSCGPSGMNFACAISGVFGISSYANLRSQVDFFKTMVKSGNVSKNHVTHSIVLVGSSVNDYKHFGIRRKSDENSAFIADVTSAIAANVERLQNLGVKRILVNNLHPFGCTPALSRAHKYKACDYFGNQDAAEHNSYLEKKLGNKKGVFIVDLHTAFDNILGWGNQNQAEDSESSYKQFKQKRKPCCEAIHPKGFCGQNGDNSEPLYTLCADPSKYFFWDDSHPTHAGWEAVMKQLQHPIKEFLGIV